MRSDGPLDSIVTCYAAV